MRFVLGFVMAFGAAAAAMACGGGESVPETEVAVVFREWEIGVEPAVVRAGDVRFGVSNEGAVGHNLVVVKSDLPPGELPVSEAGAVDTSKLNVSGGAGPFAPGTSVPGGEGFGTGLSAGKYVLLCDVVAGGESHYRNGMFVGFLVEP